MKKRIELFAECLRNLKDGMTIAFNRGNVAFGDDFLILTDYRWEIKVTFKQHGGLWWLYFDGCEPMMLEDVPTSFLQSIVNNLPITEEMRASMKNFK